MKLENMVTQGSEVQRFRGSGFRVQGSGFKVQGSGFKVTGHWLLVALSFELSALSVSGYWFSDLFGLLIYDC
jgi:hypothetical protein